jgi:hypothetical protein
VIVFELGGPAVDEGWTLVGFAFTASAWYVDGTPIVIGGAFQSVETTSLKNLSHTYTLPQGDSMPGSERASVTLTYTTGQSGTGVGFIYATATNVQDVIISLGLTITAKSPNGDTYSSHDPQVVLGPQH